MPESKTDKKSCHKCHKTYDKKLKKRKVCKCHAITYCGEECQIADWPRHQDNCLPVMVTEVEEKGRGLVASRNIKMGEQILVDTAVFPLAVPDGVVTRMVALSLKNQIQDLSKEKETKFYKLETSVKNLSISEVKIGKKENCLRELQIFQNSQLRDEITPGFKEYEILFFNLSLINHSCAPNTEWALATFSKKEDERGGVYELRATKDIYKGEEITMYYLHDMDLPLGQNGLDLELGFNCKCNVCCGILDGQESIVEKYLMIFTTLRDWFEMYKMGPEDWKKEAIKHGMMVALSKQLYVGRAETKRKSCTSYACAAHMARDPVLLEKAMAEWKELMMKTGLEYMRTGYKTFEKFLATWSSDFKTKNPPSKEEINTFFKHFS